MKAIRSAAYLLSLDEQVAVNARAAVLERLLKASRSTTSTLWLQQQIENCNAALAGREARDLGPIEVAF